MCITRFNVQTHLRELPISILLIEKNKPHHERTQYDLLYWRGLAVGNSYCTPPWDNSSQQSRWSSSD